KKPAMPTKTSPVFCSQTRLSGVHAQQGRRELSCHKSLQILHTLAHANPVNRDRTYALRTGCNGSQRTAFGCTVQLGDNQTSQPQGRIKRTDLGNGVLAGVAVYNQENFMGSLAIGLANHTLDLLELFHQVQLSRQATGSVHHDHTHITSTACMYRIKSHGGGVATILSNNAEIIARSEERRVGKEWRSQ